MNFLAHLYLADDTGPSMIGNLMPDLVRGPLPDDLHPEVLEGALRHRKVDAYCDRHPAFSTTRKRLRPRHGVYSPILVDVLYDHVLATQWNRWHSTGLSEFIAHAYDSMLGEPDLMPDRMRAIIQRMADEDWLGCYATADGIALTLRRMSCRLSERFDRPVVLETAVEDFASDPAGYVGDFEELFVDMIEFLSAK